jgi:hypothetical protein
MARHVISKLKITEVLIGDTMSENFTKADAEGKLEKMAVTYAAEHKVTKAVAYTKVLDTAEGEVLYAKSLQTPRAENIAKSAATGNVTAETLAKSQFPTLSPVGAMNAWLQTDEGREFYSDDVAARTRAQQGF